MPCFRRNVSDGSMAFLTLYRIDAIIIPLPRNARQQGCLAATSWRIIHSHGSKSKCPCGTLPFLRTWYNERGVVGIYYKEWTVQSICCLIPYNLSSFSRLLS